MPPKQASPSKLNPSSDRIKITRKFQLYRGESKQTKQQVIDTFQLQDFVAPAPVQPLAPIVNAFPPRPRRDPEYGNQYAQGFLDLEIEELADATNTDFAGGPGNWKGDKLLGEGGNSRVGLWKYLPANREPGQIYHQVAVKESTGDDPDNLALDPEDLIGQILLTTGSVHVNHILTPGVAVVNSQADGLDDVWNGRVRRLIMEYCSLGDLDGLLTTFQRLGRPIRELTVWRIFECLIDGLGVMEYGREMTRQAPRNNFQGRPELGWDSIIHFDLKPGNNVGSPGRG